jgi:hypothetical protein
MTHAYDGFIEQLQRAGGSIRICDDLDPDDGLFDSTWATKRTVMEVRFTGYKKGRGSGKATPHVAEVFSCGHEREQSVGKYRWRRPRKTIGCSEGYCRRPIDEKPSSGIRYELRGERNWP